MCHIFIHKINGTFSQIYSIYILETNCIAYWGKIAPLLGEKQAVIAVKTGRISPNCEKYSPALERKPNGNPGIGQNLVRLFPIGENTIRQFSIRGKKALEKFTYCKINH